MPRREPTARKAEIVAIAGQLFATRGFHGTSLRDIGNAVGMRRGSLYSHFKSKEEIVALLLGPALGALRTALDEASRAGGNGAERLDRALASAVACCIENRDAFLVLFQDRQLIADAPALHEVSEQANAITPLWLALITAGQGDHSLRADLTPTAIALGINSLLMGALSNRNLGLRAATGARPESPAELGRIVRILLFQGIAQT
jgi:AcrR family transcriptional regulator